MTCFHLLPWLVNNLHQKTESGGGTQTFKAHLEGKLFLSLRKSERLRISLRGGGQGPPRTEVDQSAPNNFLGHNVDTMLLC